MRRGEKSLVSVMNKKSVGRRMMKVFNNQAESRRRASNKRTSQKSHSGSEFPKRNVWCFRQNVAVEVIRKTFDVFEKTHHLSCRNLMISFDSRSNYAVSDVSRPSDFFLSKNCTQLSFSPSLYVSSMFLPIFLTVPNCSGWNLCAAKKQRTSTLFLHVWCVDAASCPGEKVLSSLQSPSNTFHPIHRHD